MLAKILRTSFVTLLIVAALSSPVLACAFHQPNFGSFFEETYPGSLSVAAAVAAARSEGRLPVTQLEDGNLGLLRASFAIRRLGSELDLVNEAPKTDFFLLLAGQQLWTHYQVNNEAERNTYDARIHVAAPTHEAPVVVTSYYVVVALQDGALTFDEALDTGLLQIRYDEGGQVAALFAEAVAEPQAVRSHLPTLLGDLVPHSPSSAQR